MESGEALLGTPGRRGPGRSSSHQAFTCIL